ncbi:MAG: tRNA lysidine(34) synthetase TilS, partial [Vicinamibacterales bacterium]|nr:tRNA lysidine(34) synthetase TilS [Vicinamibacterales bacterium]
MSSLAVEFVRRLREGCLLGPGDRVVAAVSGGGDSVALLHLLAESGPRLGVTLAGAAHLHHGLRGAAADEDLACVRRHCDALRVPLHVEQADVAGLARATGRSIEAAGRAARESCYERARTAYHATHVATGHTMEDQAETVLLRLARGAGVSALAGIRAARGHLVRPLLGLRREALREYLAERNL